MALKPPQHAADADAVVVLREDDAWDFDRIADEKKQLEDPSAHPVERYWSGETRYDIDTGGVRGYLKDASKPWLFTLRRLDSKRMRSLGSMMTTDQQGAFREMCRYALKSTENVPHTFKGAANGRLTEDDLQWLYDAGDLDVSIGVAAWWHSQPLTDAEKKR